MYIYYSDVGNERSSVMVRKSKGSTKTGFVGKKKLTAYSNQCCESGFHKLNKARIFRFVGCCGNFKRKHPFSDLHLCMFHSVQTLLLKNGRQVNCYT